MKQFFESLWHQAYTKNIQNITSLLEKNSKANALDVGCGDGQNTLHFKTKLASEKITGIDAVIPRLTAAKKRGLITKKVNLETKWPLEKNSFDVIVSNQVIEHILDLDNFIGEIHRLLKPGGYCVISTENLSSWHNIFALVLGYQDFSHHILKKAHISNPLSPHYGQKTASWSKKANSGTDDTNYPHIKIFTYISLIRAFETYGFKFEKGLGSGYYPLFKALSKLASTLDPYHSHFITIKLRKPTN